MEVSIEASTQGVVVEGFLQEVMLSGPYGMSLGRHLPWQDDQPLQRLGGSYEDSGSL